MKIVIGFSILIIVCVIAEKNAIAQNLKFGHVNINELVQAMPEFDSARVNLEKFRKELMDHLESMSAELNTKYESYLKTGKDLNEIIRQTREQELNDLDRRIQEYQATAQTQLQNKQTELFQPVYVKADKAIKDVGKENGYFYIFDVSQEALLLYFDQSMSTDVTAPVKAKLKIK